MPIYMDVHSVPGVKAKGVAEAHQKDLIHQHEFGCKAMTYWIDEEREKVFCLVEAPEKEAVEKMHRKAHGLIPNKIIEVKSTLVKSFLGRIYDPENAETSEDGLKVFQDPSFRILLITHTADPHLLKHKLGAKKATELLNQHNKIIRKYLQVHDGREAEHEGHGFIISFASASKAVRCALAIREEMPDPMTKALNLRMVINGGEPVEKSGSLFGDTIQLGSSLFTLISKFKIAVASSLKGSIAKDFQQPMLKQLFMLSPKDESLLHSLYNSLEENWQDGDFNISDYGQAMAMSKSQLYRKTVSLTGLSPNVLLKEFRLEKAKELMRKQQYNIAQVTFDSGFTSASYFTKCFKKKYGLLPTAYLEQLQ